MLESFSGVWRKRLCGDGDNGFAFCVLRFAFWVLRTQVTPGSRKTQNPKRKTQNLKLMRGRSRLRRRRSLNGRRRPTHCRRQLEGLAHVVIANNQYFKRIGPPGNHIASRNVSNELRSFTGIDNNVSRSLIARLIVSPLGKFFAAHIPKDEIVFPAVVKLKVRRLF